MTESPIRPSGRTAGEAARATGVPPPRWCVSGVRCGRGRGRRARAVPGRAAGAPPAGPGSLLRCRCRCRCRCRGGCGRSRRAGTRRACRGGEGCRDDRHADDEGVEEDGVGEAEAQGLDHGVRGADEAGEDADHDEDCGGDDGGAVLETRLDRGAGMNADRNRECHVRRRVAGSRSLGHVSGNHVDSGAEVPLQERTEACRERAGSIGVEVPAFGSCVEALWRSRWSIQPPRPSTSSSDARGLAGSRVFSSKISSALRWESRARPVSGHTSSVGTPAGALWSARNSGPQGRRAMRPGRSPPVSYLILATPSSSRSVTMSVTPNGRAPAAPRGGSWP